MNEHSMNFLKQLAANDLQKKIIELITLNPKDDDLLKQLLDYLEEAEQ